MAKKQLIQNFPLFQQLLFPKVVHTDPARVLLISETQEYLQKLGFIIKIISKSDVVIECVPPLVKTGEEERILIDILDQYLEFREEKILDATENMAKSFSCKAAIKTGDRLSEEEMRRLIDELFATENPYICPHGRPVVLKISLDEFDRRFGRSS
jgi:DNA mismatch repair protein MutL